MGILDNLENAWDLDPEQNLNWCHSNTPEFESASIIETDAMGRDKFWQEEPNLAVKLFSDTCCSECSCKP